MMMSSAIVTRIQTSSNYQIREFPQATAWGFFLFSGPSPCSSSLEFPSLVRREPSKHPISLFIGQGILKALGSYRTAVAEVPSNGVFATGLVSAEPELWICHLTWRDDRSLIYCIHQRIIGFSCFSVDEQCRSPLVLSNYDTRREQIQNRDSHNGWQL